VSPNVIFIIPICCTTASGLLNTDAVLPCKISQAAKKGIWDLISEADSLVFLFETADSSRAV
jgi:hypothetical protein